MGDGDTGDGSDALPGRRHAVDPDDAGWVTRSTPPPPTAAPWERGSGRSVPPAPPGPSRDSPTEGAEPPKTVLTVADLLAKVGHPPRRRGARAGRPGEVDAPAPADRWTPEPSDPAPPDPAFVLPDGCASEIPDLDRLARDTRDTDRWGDDHDDHDDHVDAATSVLPALRAGHLSRRARPGRSRRAATVGRVAVATLAVMALTLTGGAWQWQSSKNRSLNTVAALDPTSRDIVDPNAQYGDENFLIVGVDTRAGANSTIGAGDQSDAAGARSDTVMLVNIPANRKRVVAVSFPRDLQITPMKCQAWNPDTGKYGAVYDAATGTSGPEEWYTESKLNSAYSYGGPKCLVKVIQKLSGLSINRFMAIDFAGFATMVDALGGVEVCSTTPIEDYELGTVLARAGRQTVDGHTALNYVRARQVTTETNGDYGRIKRQQLFLSSLLRSLISRDVFFSLSKLNNVVNMFIADSYVDNIGTKELVSLGQSIQGVSAGRITFVTVPTSGEVDGMGNEIPRSGEIRALFDAIITDAPLPGEEAADGSAGATSGSGDPAAPSPVADTAQLLSAVTTAPQDVTVHVSNSTGRSGLGATAAGELQQHGFKVTSPDDYPSTLASTTVFFSSGNEQAAATVSSAFGNAHVERVGGMGDTVQVVLGPDFAAVNPPAPSGRPVQIAMSGSTGGSGAGSAATTSALPDDLTVTNAADTTCE